MLFTVRSSGSVADTGQTGVYQCGLEPPLQRGLHRGPVVVDHRVPGGVAPLAAADDHVPAVDALELRRDRGQSSAGTFVLRVGLELDPPRAERLEGVAQEQVLGLGVRAGAPRRRVHPRVADLEPQVLRRE